MAMIHIGGVTWQDGELSGDADQLRQISRFLEQHDGARLPVFGNGPWVEPDLTSPDGFLAVAQPALGIDVWVSEGVPWPPFAVNPSDQTDTVA